MLYILGAFAEFEREMIRERTVADVRSRMAGLRDWAKNLTGAIAERVPGSGEPHSASAATQASAWTGPLVYS